MMLVIKNLPIEIIKNKIDFVIANGENAATNGVGITEKITKNLFESGSRCNNNRKSCLGSKRNFRTY